MKKSCLLLFCFGAAFYVTAAENTTKELIVLKDTVNRAIIKFEHTERELWSYTISRYEDEEGDITSSIEQYSPQASQPWLLKQINGQQPTKKQIEKFAINKNKQEQEGNIQLKLRKLIDLESLSLVSTDDKNIVVGFNVYLKKLGEDAAGKLQGELTYQKEAQFIEKISIWNSAEFSPMFTANITDLAITFTFTNIDGAVLTKQTEMKMKGSFAYFTEINETSQDVFSEHQYQGKTVNSTQ
ncbi:hypothetical protein RGQ13_04520 [Thalassotalea psychrophila]|uniref:Uncharacterized protein n=1 Tax=Thalassotalea psychrophila TaxID=3065647 RepID=A0ABY9TWN9_9GAMM|nr:hypothetical protein RGQ13_04520 [Colwelliaceae bacterium SQ149]